ncbi:hypothetical protein HGG74_13835 [Arthrobacter sp. E918]|uniref:Uncharacterized protein n=1 Tax=Arthrobacter mobilis TaxID=2724944 RepID=A0A7X6K4Q1_9MICC|nr:hypothetical protein [Arthrobacter mobilis]
MPAPQPAARTRRVPGHGPAEVLRPRSGRAEVWAESPLQLLSAVEAHSAGLLGRQTVVRPRAGAGMAGTVALLRDQAPAGLTIEDPPAGPAQETAAAPPGRPDRWVAGDAYSGQVQAGLLRGLDADELVLLDDGLASLKLLATLVQDRPAALTRPRSRATAPRRMLGLASWHRLRRLARQGRLLVVTALPVPDAVERRFRALGGKLERHRFEWLGTRPVTEIIREPTVLVGSAMPADGLIHPGPYIEWVRSLTEDGPVSYFPHRRETPQLLEALAAHPLIRVNEHTVPVEMRLRGLQPGQVVRSLPSTVLASLRLVLAPDGVRLRGHDVPGHWWTPQASAELRRHLGSCLDEAAAGQPGRP